MERRIFCFGDSNTYGYDPREPFGGRYPADARWPELLGAATGAQVTNAGKNGRKILTSPRAWQRLDNRLRAAGPQDGLIVMLGTNDVLTGYLPAARDIAEKMEAMLTHLRAVWPGLPVLLLAPPPVAVPDGELAQVSRQLAREYAALARRMDLAFADAGAWGLPLAFDGVHLTPEGHRRLARALAPLLPEIFWPEEEPLCRLSMPD